MENKEQLKTQEQLVEETARIIFDNLTKTGLAAQIVAKSMHSREPFSTDFYNGINFGYEMGTGEFVNGVWAQPRITNVTRRGDITTKIYRLKVEKGIENKIWEGVSDQHRKALILSAIEYQEQKYQSERNSGDLMRESGENEQEVQRIIEEAESKLAVLKKLRTGLEDGSVIQEISSQQISLGVRLK